MNFVIGGLAGTVAVTICYPTDFLRRNYQVSVKSTLTLDSERRRHHLWLDCEGNFSEERYFRVLPGPGPNLLQNNSFHSYCIPHQRVHEEQIPQLVTKIALLRPEYFNSIV
jgi:Mitochondrial carrier protein